MRPSQAKIAESLVGTDHRGEADAGGVNIGSLNQADSMLVIQ